MLKGKVYAENSTIAELDAAIKTTNSEIIELKRKAGSNAGGAETGKQARVLENRVDKVNNRYQE